MIIGLLGKAGSGKTTVANWLVKERGARRFSLAAPLKEMARAVYGLSYEQVWGTQADKEAPDERLRAAGLPGGCTPRELLQHLGTDVCRRLLGADVWVRAAFLAVDAEPGALWVCDDVRFPNEADAVRSRGGKVLKLTCPDAPASPGAGHASEDVDHVPYDRWVVSTRAAGDLILLAGRELDEMLGLTPPLPR